MSLDVSSDIFKTKLKNTILKKGFQGSNPKPEQIARFKWLNYDGSQTIQTPAHLFEFIERHGYVHLLPSDDAILPDLVSAIRGEIVFISEYPRLAKMFEQVFDAFYKDFVQKALVFEYPLVQSTHVLISREEFKKLYALKLRTSFDDEHEQAMFDYVSENGPVSKKAIKDHFRINPYVFQRIDYYVYKLQQDLRIYKIGFDAIEGNIFDMFTQIVPDWKAESLPETSVDEILEKMVGASLYVNPVQLQRALKKQFSKEVITESLNRLIESGVLYKTKIDREPVLVHKAMFEANR
ncbi:MAG: hypothetical protein J0L62_05280 [Bacteroidetes bacterium]|nr:hypothetical protein [Bacteroidota bacterium]